MTDELPVVTSPFQKSAVTAISQRADFSRFVLLQGESWPNKYGKPGPFVVPWYDKSGTLHAHRIGCNKILQEVEA